MPERFAGDVEFEVSPAREKGSEDVEELGGRGEGRVSVHAEREREGTGAAEPCCGAERQGFQGCLGGEDKQESRPEAWGGHGDFAPEAGNVAEEEGGL